MATKSKKRHFKSKELNILVPMGSGIIIFSLLIMAWFQIQSVRIGYDIRDIHQQLDQIKKEEQFVNRRLQNTLSLSRIDQLARLEFNLKVPKPSQIVFISDES